MRRGAFVVFALAFLVALGWPLTSAIGAATARAVANRGGLEPAGCSVPDASAANGAVDDGTDADTALPLPPGHPPVGAFALPPGHPRIDADGLPPGHPRIGSRGLPPGHPPIPSGQPGPAAPTPLFNDPVLLNI